MVKAKPKQATELTTGGSALEFRKTNEAIGLRVSEGRLSLLSRKTFNLMVYHAQKLGVPGQNAPLDTPVAQKYFWIPLTDLARDAAYDSKDTELLKKSVQELQDIRIYMEDEKQWTSERLVSSVKIVNSAGLKRRGGRVWFGFAFPPEVANLVMNPGAYTKLSIYYQTMLRSGASLALYEICRRFATNPSRLSSRERWEWWYGALSGNPVTEGLPQYKYFKRDVLKTSIAEINAVTDIEVELLEHKLGRKVVDLQFRIRLNEQPALDLPAPPLIDAAMIERLMQLGIAQEEATAIFVSHDDATLRATLDLVEERVRSTKAPPLDSPAAYFKSALRNRYASPRDVARKTLATTAAAEDVIPAVERGPTLRERYAAKRSREATDYFNEIDPQQRDALLLEYEPEAPRMIAAALRRNGLHSKVAQTGFFAWLASRLWGDASDKDLLAFAESEL
ncbi:replication initiation protein [Pararobbsia alpina]|uniref:Initiator Rep protein WH1 domain-containing protein n=1 Tax=Pararobbsia alpina TaxID=621374 RepID=A0A6S7CYV2_9BURK|nr:replication initiation protein [Pararobbsia alpina]CAB3791564.1 hypothetical protein LMG28138_03186 [Pararobbsia alpina]